MIIVIHCITIALWHWGLDGERNLIRIEGLSWDERSEEHIATHGIRFEDVEEAVQRILYHRRSGEYLLVIGQDASGRHLTIVLDDDGDGLWYPVTARLTSGSERRLLKRKKAGAKR